MDKRILVILHCMLSLICLSANGEIIFPKDHGPHFDNKLEWWYVTGNLKNDQGEKFGFQWTLFRFSDLIIETENSNPSQFWMGHSALTGTDFHNSFESISAGDTGRAGVRFNPFTAFIDDWRLESKAPEGFDLFSSLTLTSNTPNFSYHLSLKTDKPIVKHGKDGISTKTESGHFSYYYSQPFLNVNGEIKIKDRVPFNVKGKAWLDREWSNSLLSVHESGWDWFALHLDNGDRLMVFQVRNNKLPFLAGTFIQKNGTIKTINKQDILLKPELSLFSRVNPPKSWRIEIANLNIDILVEPDYPNPITGDLFRYWEGPITVSGNRSGVGYLEMTGYAFD